MNQHEHERLTREFRGWLARIRAMRLANEMEISGAILLSFSR